MLKYSYTLLTVFAVDLLATAGDITLSWTSPIYPKLYSNDTSINPLGKPITEEEDAWIGSLVTIGAMIGPLPYGFISERFGRKIGLLCIAIPHIISYFIMAFAKHIYLFYIGRIFGGLAMGGTYTILPMYIAEVSKASNRGMMSQTSNIFWAIGNFIPYAIGPFVSVMWFNIILAVIPTVFFFLFLCLAPETPYYLVNKNKIEKAEKSLMLLRGLDKKDVQKELSSIRAHVKIEENDRLSNIFKNRGLRKAFIICVVLIMTQELCGFCAIAFYLQPIFEAAGTSISADISALVVGFAMLVSSFVSPTLIDRAGRKILTVYSCFGMFFALILLGLFFHLQDTNFNTERIFWLPIFSLIFYIVSFNIGICSIPWTLTSELFPNNVKQASSTAISIICWVTSFVMTKFFNDMNKTMGRAGTFWFFAVSCLLAAIFSIVYVPETKGKSFSEIQDMLNNVPPKEVYVTEMKDILKT